MLCGMCAGCALAAMTGASATRSWLQAQHLTWLTPQRMKVADRGPVRRGDDRIVGDAGRLVSPGDHAAPRARAARRSCRALRGLTLSHLLVELGSIPIVVGSMIS